MPHRSSCGLRGLTALGLLLSAGLGSFVGAQPQTGGPPGATPPKYSTKAADAAPQLLRSLEHLIQAANVLKGDPGPDAARVAALHCQEAYALQRAAHAGIGWKRQQQRLPQYDEAIRIVAESRKHLLACSTHFHAPRMREGSEALRAATAQTRLAVALIN